MGLGQIENPIPAFSSAGQDNIQQFSNVQVCCTSAGTFLANQIVALQSSGTGSSATVSCIGASAGNVTWPGGVALDASTATGQVIRVVTYGPALLNFTTATYAQGAVFSVASANSIFGYPASASTVIGSNFGIVMETTVAATQNWVFVGKM